MPVEQLDNEVLLIHPSQPETRVKILNYGAHVYSWEVKGQEQLWLSTAAKLDGSRPVRGGIPLAFPIFGKKSDEEFSTLPQHGFARNSTWEFLGQVSSNPVTVQFGLGPENVAPAILEASNWAKDNDFTVIYTVTLGDSTLETELSVENTNLDKPLRFNALFHTYYKISDISATAVKSLTGFKCTDKVGDKTGEVTEAAVGFNGEVDRVYQKASEDVKATPGLNLSIEDATRGPLFRVTTSDEVNDVVVWNPWIEKANSMGDFEPKDGYKTMVCVEPGAVSDYVSISPGEKWTGSQKIEALQT